MCEGLGVGRVRRVAWFPARLPAATSGVTGWHAFSLSNSSRSVIAETPRNRSTLTWTSSWSRSLPLGGLSRRWPAVPSSCTGVPQVTRTAAPAGSAVPAPRQRRGLHRSRRVQLPRPRGHPTRALGSGSGSGLGIGRPGALRPSRACRRYVGWRLWCSGDRGLVQEGNRVHHSIRLRIL